MLHTLRSKPMPTKQEKGSKAFNCGEIALKLELSTAK